MRLEDNVRLQLIKYLIVPKIRVLRQVKYWHLLEQLIVLVVVHFYEALSNKV